MKKPIKPPQDSFFDLSVEGKIPALLRAIADRIESRRVHPERFESSVTEDHVDISMRIGLNQK